MGSRASFRLAAAGMAATLAPFAQGSITLANGQSARLDSVLSGDRQVIIGDKLFTFTTYTSGQFPTDQVFVTGFIAANPNDGIGFDLTGGFGDISPGNAGISEFNLLYTVEIVPSAFSQGYRLKDIGLAFNGAATGNGSYARVDETVFDFNGVPGQNQLAAMSAAVIAGGSANYQDFRNFLPAFYTKFQVNKDAKFFAQGAADSSSASFVRQTFSQFIVPAPGAAALVGLGGLVATRRRRS